MLGTLRLELLLAIVVLLIVLFAEGAVAGFKEEDPIVLDVFRLTAEGAPSKLFLGLELDLLLSDEEAPLLPPIALDCTIIDY